MESNNGKWSKLQELLDAQHELLSKYMCPSNELETLQDIKYELDEEIDRFKDAEPVDEITSEVIGLLAARSHKGVRTYNASMDRSDLSTKEWMIHLHEELLDASLYLMKLIKTTDEIEKINEANKVPSQ